MKREERGLEPLKVIAILRFISQSPLLKKEHNDLDLIFDEKAGILIRFSL